MNSFRNSPPNLIVWLREHLRHVWPDDVRVRHHVQRCEGRLSELGNIGIARELDIRKFEILLRGRVLHCLREAKRREIDALRKRSAR